MTIEAGSLKYKSGQTRINSQFWFYARVRRGDTKRQTQTASRWNQGKVEMNFYTHLVIVLAKCNAWKITTYHLFIVPNYVL